MISLDTALELKGAGLVWVPQILYFFAKHDELLLRSLNIPSKRFQLKIPAALKHLTILSIEKNHQK